MVVLARLPFLLEMRFRPPICVERLARQVVHLYSADHAFAALRADGSIVTWGDDRHGGDIREATVAAKQQMAW